MAGLLEHVSDDRKWLLVCAAPAEGRAVGRAFHHRVYAAEDAAPVRWAAAELSSRFELLVTGVGKANAAGGVGRVLDPARHSGVICLGVCGSLPRSGLELLQVVLADRSVFADEGVRTPTKFLSMAQCGFPPAQGAEFPGISKERMGVEPSERLRAALAGAVDRVGTVATVSTCSGRNRLAIKVVEQTGAVVEAMEGAAAGFTALRIGAESGARVEFAEIRVVSNSTGNRAKQRWDLPGALERLTEVARALHA